MAHLAVIAALLLSPAARAKALRWDLSDPRQITACRNFVQPTITADGRMVGLTQWDPYISLRLPEGGIEPSAYRTLRARIFSSAPADLLDIYYKTEKGYWCLGGRLKIHPGWAVYTVDLPSNAWRETLWPQARRWGGPAGAGRVVSLRIDPGNQQGRWVMIDWVELSPQQAETRVDVEPKVRATARDLGLPAAVKGGEKFTVAARWEVEREAEGKTVTLFARLRGATAIYSYREKTVAIGAGGTVAARFSLTAPGWTNTKLIAETGIYEACGAEGYSDVRKEVQVLSQRPARGFPHCRIEQIGGSPALIVNGRPEPFFCFASASAGIGGTEMAAEAHEKMARHGVRIFSDWFGRSYDGFLGRTEDGTYDYTLFDLYFAEKLRQAPEALFLPHVYVTPPKWWQVKHPEEMCRLDDGSTAPMSLTSAAWRREMADDLRKLIEHFSRQPYGERIIGLVVCGGYTAEWQTWGLWQNKFADYSKPAVEAWRRWLAKRYGDDRALRKAWGSAEASIETALPPTPQQRKAAALLGLRHPIKDGQVLDYLEFLNEMTADAILHFASVAKKASGGRLIVGTYYGYLTQHHYHQAESGHLGIEKVLASPHIDFLMSPPLYTQRGIDGVAGFMSATDSVQRHGKIWLSEADYRTFLSDPGAGYGRTATADETLNVLWREFAHVLCKRAAVSWFDMGPGWLSGEPIPEQLGKMRRIMADYISQRRPWQAQVAVFIDPRSFMYVKPDPDLGGRITLWPVVNLMRCGAPFDLYVLSDLGNLDLKGYKLYVFLNAYALDERQRRAIAKYVRRPGVASLWFWAAGYVWPEQRRLASDAEMSELVGLKLRRADVHEAVQLSGQGCPERYVRRLAALDTADNPAQRIGPVWLPESGERLVALSPTGETALARGQRDGATVFYCAVPQIPSAIMRQVYLDAGVHVFVDDDVCLYADDGWLGVQSRRGGFVRIRLPGAERIESVRRLLQMQGQTISVPWQAHFTDLLRRKR